MTVSLVIFVQQLVVLYAIGFAGFSARKIGILNEHSNEVLTQLILSLTLPFLILYSMDQPYTMKIANHLFWLIPMSAFILILSCVLAFLLMRLMKLPENQQSVFEGLIVFGNQGFIGYALITSLFPELGALYVTIFNFPYLILIWTYGIYLFVGRKDYIPWRKIFFNPGILSTFLGLLIFVLPIQWPSLVSNLLKSIGNMTIPLSMLVIGIFAADMNLKKTLFLLKGKSLWVVTSFRLLIIPILLFPFIFLPLPFPLLATAILVSGMPSASTIALYAQKFGGDKDYAAMGTLWTTLLSILTLPALYILLILFI